MKSAKQEEGKGWLREWAGLPPKRRIFSVILLAISSLSLWICLRIEWLNREAGHKLPRDTSHFPPGASRAWRAIAEKPEEVRKQMARNYQLEQIDRYLTTNQLDQLGGDVEISKDVWMEIDRRLPEVVQRNRIVNELHGTTALGILQYPLCLALIVGGCWRDRRKSGRLELSVYGFALLTGALGLVRAWQLSYASSVFD